MDYLWELPRPALLSIGRNDARRGNNASVDRYLAPAGFSKNPGRGTGQDDAVWVVLLTLPPGLGDAPRGQPEHRFSSLDGFEVAQVPRVPVVASHLGVV